MDAHFGDGRRPGGDSRGRRFRGAAAPAGLIGGLLGLSLGLLLLLALPRGHHHAVCPFFRLL